MGGQRKGRRSRVAARGERAFTNKHRGTEVWVVDEASAVFTSRAAFSFVGHFPYCAQYIYVGRAEPVLRGRPTAENLHRGSKGCCRPSATVCAGIVAATDFDIYVDTSKQQPGGWWEGCYCFRDITVVSLDYYESAGRAGEGGDEEEGVGQRSASLQLTCICLSLLFVTYPTLSTTSCGLEGDRR